MTTAIAVYNSEGLVGRCDAKCHDAKEPDCGCICGGRLHGSGSNAIAQNTRDLLGEDLTNELLGFAHRNELDPADLRLEWPQLPLELA